MRVSYRGYLFIAVAPLLHLCSLPVLFLLGCGGSPSTTNNIPQLTRLTVAPPTSDIALGQTVQVTATGILTDGSSRDETGTAIWTSSKPDVASINSSGLVTSYSLGTTMLTASTGALTAESTLIVSQAEIVSIAVDPSVLSLALGTTTQLKATGLYTDGSTRNVTPSVAWTSSEPSIAVVSATGIAITKAVGVASLTAVSGSAKASSQLTVLPAALDTISVSNDRPIIPLGATAQFKARGIYTDSTSHDLTNSVSWSSSTAAIVTIDGSGLATGKSVGTATIKAAMGSIETTGTVTVSAAQLTSILVSAPKAVMPLGTSQHLGAQGTYTDGTTHDLTNSVSWSSDSAQVLSVGPGGECVANTRGTAIISASTAGVVGKVTLTVSPAALATITISPSNASIPLGSRVQFSAGGIYTDGSTHNLTNSVSWSSSPPGIMTIDASGIATGRTKGPATVTAALGSIAGLDTVTVAAPRLTSIAIAPANPIIPLAKSQQLTALGTFTDGTQDVISQVTWTVNDPAIVGVASTGNATGKKVGSTSVEARMNDIVGAATIVVQPIALTSYFSSASTGADTTIRIANPGGEGDNACAMLYVFDQNQQMAECCGCHVSQDGLRTQSLSHDLTANTLTGVQPITGSLMLVTADYKSNPSCGAAFITPGGEGVAWATHLQTVAPGTFSISETSFSETPLTPTLSSALQAQCQFIQLLGSGQGVCQCGTGD